MSRETDRAEALRNEIVRALVEECGLREVMALPWADSIVAYLQRERGGETIYVPKPPRGYPIDQIAEDLRRGADIGDVCAAYRISRRTLNRLFPGGVPMPSEIA